MKCAICGGELVEGALCSSYPIWFYPLDSKGRPDDEGKFRLRSLANRPISDMFTVTKARAQYCQSCKTVFTPAD